VKRVGEYSKAPFHIQSTLMNKYTVRRCGAKKWVATLGPGEEHFVFRIAMPIPSVVPLCDHGPKRLKWEEAASRENTSATQGAHS
jgi:hypothetical protein